MSVRLVTLTAAKAHLRLLVDNQDFDVDLKIEEASDIVLGWANQADPDDWALGTSPETYLVPARFRSACLLVLTELFTNRDASSNPLSDTVKSILWRDRCPVQA